MLPLSSLTTKGTLHIFLQLTLPICLVNMLNRFSLKCFSFIWNCFPERMMRLMTGVMSGRNPSPGCISTRRWRRHLDTLFHDSPIVTSSSLWSISRRWPRPSLPIVIDLILSGKSAPHFEMDQNNCSLPLDLFKFTKKQLSVRNCEFYFCLPLTPPGK